MARSVDPEQVAARREALTLAAADLFAQQGFENTTAKQIAGAAQLSSGSVFYYFEDKRAVFRSLFERDIPASRELVDRCLHMESDPLTSINTMVEAMAADTLEPNAVGILVELLRQVDKDPELARVVIENETILREGLATLIRRGIDAGAIDSELDPHEAASWIQSLLDGAFLNAAPETDPRPFLRRTVTRFLVAQPGGEASA